MGTTHDKSAWYHSMYDVSMYSGKACKASMHRDSIPLPGKRHEVECCSCSSQSS